MTRQIYISSTAESLLKEWIGRQGCQICEVSTTGIVAESVSDHPDMFICRLGMGIDTEVVSYFAQNEVKLRPDYPFDIAYNAACTGKFFIHNLKYTAPELLERARQHDMTFVDVRQGYAKCSTVIVNATSIITYDEGLGKACFNAGMDVLLVSPGHIALPGYNTGFIGGTSGRIGDTVIFNGDLSAHPDFSEIKQFIENRGLGIKWFREWALTDIGSII